MKEYQMYQEGARERIVELHKMNLDSFGVPYETFDVQTSFGRTSVDKIGNPDGKPVIAIGGHRMINCTIFNKLTHLFDEFCFYSPSVIGQAGLSEDGLIDPKNYGFGKWLAEVIKGLDLKEKPAVLGASFGGGVVANVICYAPELVSKAVMMCPIGVTRMNYIPGIKASLRYKKNRRNHDIEAFRREAIMTNSHNGVLDENSVLIATEISAHCNIKDNFPMNVRKKDLPEGKVPAILYYGDKDYLYPAERVTATFKKYYPSCERFLMKDYGHTAFMNEEGKVRLREFLRG